MYMIEKKLKSCLEEVFKQEKIPKDIKKLKFGSFKTWDSLSHLNLLLVTEKKFKIKFSLDEMYKIKTVKDILSAINKNR